MGFEVVVRPLVLPNIRPQVPRVLPPPDDPTQGFATLSGGGGKFIGTSYSFSFSISRSKSHQTETRRQVDTERVYKTNPGGGASRAGKAGNVDKSIYIDVERTTKIQTDDEKGLGNIQYQQPAPRDNVEVLETGKTIEGG